MAGGAVMAMPASSQENRKGSLLFIALADSILKKRLAIPVTPLAFTSVF
jgi:hypothetical protein